MTWTYTPTASPVSSKDKVRLLIGDTNSAAPQLTDEEITTLLSLRGSVYSTAELACFTLATKYSLLVDKTVGELRIRYGQRSIAYAARAKDIKQHGASSIAIPFSGGLTRTGKSTVESDDDRVNPGIQIGMHDNRESGAVTAQGISVNTSP